VKHFEKSPDKQDGTGADYKMVSEAIGNSFYSPGDKLGSAHSAIMTLNSRCYSPEQDNT
jgi:hypothetical protein